MNDGRSFSVSSEDDMGDVYPLKLRLSILQERNSLGVKISKKSQYRSTLVCPHCRKCSITFDPFMFLSLPLPSTSMRTMTLTVMTADGSSQQSPITVTVPKNGKLEDLIQALSNACSIGVDKALLVAEIYGSRIIRYLEDPVDSLSLIRDEDRLVAYRLPKDFEKFPGCVYTSADGRERYEYDNHGKLETVIIDCFMESLVG